MGVWFSVFGALFPKERSLLLQMYGVIIRPILQCGSYVFIAHA